LSAAPQDRGKAVQHIQFNGVTFTHTFRTLFQQPYDSLLMSDWRIARAGAVFSAERRKTSELKIVLLIKSEGMACFVNGYNRNHVILRQYLY